MQKTFVKVSALAVAMGLAAAANADVSVPTMKGGFNVSVEANYLKPYGQDVSYGTKEDSVTDFSGVISPVNTHTSSSFLNEPKFKMGFGVNVGFIFPNTGNDVSVSYNRYRNTAESDTAWNNDSTTISADGKETKKYYPEYAASQMKIKQDQIDLLVGQYINVGSNLQMHLKGGLSYAKLSVDTTKVGLTPNSDKQPLDNYAQEDLGSSFKGLGPTLGLDTVYGFGNTGFGITSGLQASLLVGKLDNTDNSKNGFHNPVNGHVDIYSTTYNNHPSTSQVVPGLAAKLGLNYDHTLNDAYKFSVEAGYQVKSYLNVFGEENGLSNLTLAGPYATFKLTAL